MSKRNHRIPAKYPNSGKPWNGRTEMERYPNLVDGIESKVQSVSALNRPKYFRRRLAAFLRRMEQCSVAQSINLCRVGFRPTRTSLAYRIMAKRNLAPLGRKSKVPSPSVVWSTRENA